MNMLLHNLKIAFRNFLKYKVQTLFSILSLAIGMVTLSVVHSVLRNFRLAEICGEPYYDRAYVIKYDSIQPRQSQESIPLNGDIVRAIKANGGLNCIEQGPYAPNGLTTGGWAEFTFGKDGRRKMQLEATAIDKHFPNYAGFHSAITGKKIKVLRPNEVVISKTLARQVFGQVNPVGARLRLSRAGKSYQLTVVDVYKDLSRNERVIYDTSLLFSPCELEDMDFENYYAVWLDVVLKENATPKQLEAEANARLKPLGLKAKVESLKESMGEENSNVRIGIMITYLIGSLILLAAIIGFLKMQTQLFWMRRREISLRITNGATRWQLFSMFATEITFMIGLACIVAIMMDAWVYDFSMTKLSDFVESLGDIHNFYPYTIMISIMVLALCFGIIWLVLQRICRSNQGLETEMRKSHSHWFRNMMLGVQIAISTFFLCTTFDFLKLSSAISDLNHIPHDERVYKESLYLRTHEADDKQRLRNALTKLPEVERCIPYNRGFYRINELAENEEISNVVWKRGDMQFSGTVTNYETHFAADASWLDYFHVKVKWKPKANRTRCILVSEKLYQKMHKLRIAPNEMLTIDEEDALPIAGTFTSIPYQSEVWNDKNSFIVIDPKVRFESEEYILVPKSGEYKELKTSVEKTIKQLEPAVVKSMVSNLRDNLADAMRAPEILQVVISILAVVSFAICLMGMFSTVMLDTRARKKEVAIRKVNGALMRDIFKLFGKTYAVIMLIGMVFAVLATLLFHVVVLGDVTSMVESQNPVLPIILGVLVVVVFIASVIAWQVKRIMQIDPSEILAKE